MKKSTFYAIVFVGIILLIAGIYALPKSKSLQAIEAKEKAKLEQVNPALLTMNTSNTLEIYSSNDIYYVNIKDTVLTSESGINIEFESMSKLSIALTELTAEDHSQSFFNNTTEPGPFKQELIDTYSK